MALSQTFAEKVAQLNTKDELKALLTSIDETKRRIRSQQSQLSSEPWEGIQTGRARRVTKRKMARKMSLLTEERDHVTFKLGRLKTLGKHLNMAMQRPSTLNDAIVAVLMATLPEEEFLALELKAIALLDNV